MKFISFDSFKLALELKNNSDLTSKITLTSIDDFQFILQENAFEINIPELNYGNLFDLLNNAILVSDLKNDKSIFQESESLLYDSLRVLLEEKFNNMKDDKSQSFKEKTLNLLNRIQIFIESNKLNLFSCLVLLFSHISFESGAIKKCLEKNDLIWGTYEFHCNAHLDNLMLIKKNNFKRLLSPIDFDLAYYKEEFIDLKYKNLKGIEAQVGFDDLMLREKNYLLIQLLGINPIPNIDVDLPYFRNILEFLQDQLGNSNQKTDLKIRIKYLENLETLLKENISLYFSKGFHECKQSKELFDKYYEIDYLLMEFILILEALI